jgi:hypothetical protein
MFSPKDAEKFWLKELDLYIDAETQPAAFCRAEKPITPNAEYVEFVDGIPQTLVRKDLIRFGMMIGVEIMEWTIDLLELTRGGDKKITDPVYDYLYFGEDYVDPLPHRLRFVSELVDDKAIEFVMLKGKATEMSEMPTGTGDYASIPSAFEALRDTTVSDTKRNMAYFRIER